MKVFLGLVISLLFFSSGVFAAKDKPQSFSRWKDAQVVSARNTVVRLTNRMHLLKTDKYKVDKDKRPLLEESDEKLYQELRAMGDAEGEKDKKSELKTSLLSSVENRMQMAIENLQIAKELSLDDYVAVYLRQFANDPKALKKIAGKFTDDEIVQLISVRLNPGGAVQPEQITDVR